MNTEPILPAGRPNILLILCDDMGYSDIGAFGSEIRTPNLDRLAQGGVRMTSVYNCARCCPSRAALLTGLYPHQAGIGFMVHNMGRAAYQGYLREDAATIAEGLAAAGYYTGYSGKWHAGGVWKRAEGDAANWRFDDPTHPTPMQRGFQRFYGNLAGGGSYFNVHLADENGLIDLPDGFYTTDNYTNAAIDMMGEAADQGRPFFVHLCYNAPHWPLHALPEDVARYRGQYRRGWDATRTARHEELKGMGLLDPRWAISPRDEQAPPWADAEAPEWQDARMAVYAAMIDRVDQNVGRMVDQLRALGQFDNTLIVFLSDNGGCAEAIKPGPRAMEIQHARDGVPIQFGDAPELTPGDPNTFMTYGLPWANASNSPFRRFKHWVHEGGISTPFIAHWPEAIPAGGIRHEQAHLVDIVATLYDVVGAQPLAEVNGQPAQALEGESFAPLLRGADWSRQAPIGWEHEGNRAWRDGDLKLVARRQCPWELYNVREDRTELHDLAARYPDDVRRMVDAYDVWAARCGVLPFDEVRRR